MRRTAIRIGVASAALFTGVAVGAPSLAGASTRAQTFAANQARLEHQLTARQAQLAKLTTEVGTSTKLTSVHRTALVASLTAETTNIDALATKVPMDSTSAALAADRASMLRDNRVYAVMTPQVVDTVRADAIAARAATEASEEAGLQASIVSHRSENGYGRAWNRYRNFVQRVTRATTASANVATKVLAQSPNQFPRNEHVFVTANSRLLNGSVALAYAAFDKSLIELFVDGYAAV